MDISNNCFLDIDLSYSVVTTFILATFSEDINAMTATGLEPRTT